MWTTIDGRHSEGELISYKDGEVTLLIDSREYVFSIDRFIPSDRDYMIAWKSHIRCGVCKESIKGDKMQAGDDFYHPNCFSCLVCERPFLNRQSIRKDEWGGMVHAEHFRKAMSCGACGRFFSKNKALPGQFLGDGRLSCRSCLKEAVTDLATLSKVSDRVRLSISEIGLPRPYGPLSLRLVNQAEMNRELNRAHGRGKLRGLTITTFRTVAGRSGVSPQTSYSHQVWILSSLPVVECVSVLAHEFGHVWMNENFIEVSPPAAEGFCNLLAMHALSKEKSKIADVLRKNLEMSDDRVYGKGFRDMSKRLDQLGWQGILNDLLSRRRPQSFR